MSQTDLAVGHRPSFSTPTVRISGESFRSKVRMALDLWTRVRPREAKAFVKECLKARDSLKRSNGFDSDGEMSLHSRMPKFVVDVLKKSEFHTNMLYQCPCGTGDSRWDTDGKLVDIFMSEMPQAHINKMSGQSRFNPRR